MIGAIAGDIVGSIHEGAGTKTKEFPLVTPRHRFTDDTVRNAISLGGDADTMACIAGGIAEAYWGVPGQIREWVVGMLDEHLRRVADEFARRFEVRRPA